MVFTSLHFAAFFIVVYGVYRALPHRGQNWWLLAASYYFYAAWDWWFLSLLIGSTLVDFAVARAIHREEDPRRRTRLLWLSLAFNFGMLGFFKYFDFFSQSLADMAALAGWHLDPVTLHVILPIGISFYTFMTVSYVVDVYRRDIRPEPSLLNFAVFVAFFPHLVAGPILRAGLLLPQIAQPRHISRTQLTEGLWLMAWGLFQKLFVADNLSGLVASAYAAGGTPTGAEVWLATIAFAFQIYGDFAGYSNLARGMSKLMGIELNVNFRFPYFVTSPQEFWRHWHISLSTWLRDYLYIPLGGNRGSAWGTSRNLMITMVLGGLWHGAAWTFVLWGVYQGLMLGIGRVAFGRGPAHGSSWQRVLAALLMFQVTCYGWLIFRAESAAQVRDLTVRLFSDWHLPAMAGRTLVLPLVLIVTPLLIVHAYQARHDDELAIARLPWPVRYALGGLIGYLVLLFGNFEGAQFIYFQF
ncbi:MAG TPA: MBOAT family O-acyltransferase [Vicinamibacterales bacterium]|nr:MBOAT family O-acyltransferase [Vicinamibacterales bacterium]